MLRPGPDGSGYLILNQITLGRRRLRIIDLVIGDRQSLQALMKMSLLG